MINTWLISGDIHGGLTRFDALKDYEPGTAAIIILGDVAFNYTADSQDSYLKNRANSYKNYIYCVRGNHEMRPEDIPTVEKFWDENVANMVYCEPEYPYIRYFIDGYCYDIGGYRTLVIGGAYSVDKFYRLATNKKWFSNEQLNKDEMDFIFNLYKNDNFDIVLSHTCPLDWQPTDLFLDCVDQDKVDNSMEVWMNKLKDSIGYDLWLFGHYHDNRAVRPHVEMLFTNVYFLEDVFNRWNSKEEIEFPPQLKIDKKFRVYDNIWIEKEMDKWIM